MKKRVITRAVDDPGALIALLAARLSLSPAKVHALVDRGAVYVAGTRATSERAIAVGAKIVVFTDIATAPPRFAFAYRDDWIAVVDKAAGVPSQAERSQRAGALEAQVQRLVGGAARMLHRLDKEASGLVLFALRERAFAPLQEALTAGAIDRRYVAIVDGELHGDGAIRLRIARHPSDRRLRTAVPEHATAGEPACSRYQVLAHATWRHRAITAVEMRLETGRTHQLRVHLRAIGHPIVGDMTYGGPAYERLCLHAYALELPHPSDRRRMRTHSPIPGPLVELVPSLTSPFA
jgi:23S rRNA pseudouridine1911/1915/1917 synthase